MLPFVVAGGGSGSGEGALPAGIGGGGAGGKPPPKPLLMSSTRLDALMGPLTPSGEFDSARSPAPCNLLDTRSLRHCRAVHVLHMVHVTQRFSTRFVCSATSACILVLALYFC